MRGMFDDRPPGGADQGLFRPATRCRAHARCSLGLKHVGEKSTTVLDDFLFGRHDRLKGAGGF